MKTYEIDKLTELREALKIANDHIEQYRAYDAAMTKLGRGVMISSPYQPETLEIIIRAALNR